MTVLIATLREHINRRVLLWGGFLSVVFLALYTLGLVILKRQLGGFGAEAEAEIGILTVLGLYMASFLSAFLALVMSASSVSAEIDGGLIHAVLARPIRRSRWLLERWGAGVVAVVCYLTFLAGEMLLVGRIVLGASPGSWSATLLLMIFQAITILTLGTALSTRMSTVASGVVVFALFGLAWLAGILEEVGQAVASEGLINAGIAASLVMPSDGLWRGASYHAVSPEVARLLDEVPFASSAPPSAAFLVWALVWTAVVLIVAVQALQRRDL